MTAALVRPEKLGPALAAALHDNAWRDFRAELIAGGKSNLTFRLRSAAGEVILRRPPSGELRPSAHDMGRECRVQQALAGSGVPVPDVLLADPEGDLLGVPSYVMSAVAGIVVRDAFPPGFSVDFRELSGNLVDTLAAIHTVDIAAAGLGDFGRAEGFLARQIRRWSAQWQAVKKEDVTAVDWLISKLTVPRHTTRALVHGDFRLDNCVLDARRPAVINAVLDWEMSTLGDPLADLALLLFYWREPGEQPWKLAPAITATPGFPRRTEIAERYAATTGADLSDLTVYLAFAHLKFAVITQDTIARVRDGAMAGQDFGDLSGEVARIAAAGLDILED
ncbi:aminoglycoside phosphotransferase (APT) family kinase protein [Actinoplanes lutulentus]|uniref:Aminoglycoside phosphotransferase (APT) family kinase protein n=1 Tax=Actinoplanes lutulentus TaxID=1287878 RepID=A0A327ZCA1_9ACTN|nr:phosphotransferase family protein [Actinoplanes lutulentus]MBB2946974.1 aminoglycoside phosphotransferase (APT) family kinase protein [Actinoplanes lutulentus]RAK30476.1 aminoglycoside phosphotransferase (APT) family kinase protein [Actinoplanes lutulentus]